MNYYRRYMADYNSKTAALSIAEHGAYTLLLDHYYATETPLPASLDALYRLCRAMTKPEQQAVKSVADTFFPVSGDGLRHNPRADGEIEKAKPVIKAARTNGVKGGRPRNNPAGFDSETPDEPTTKASQPLISQPLAFQPLTAQPPTPKKSKSTPAARSAPASRKSSMPSGFEVSERVKAWASEKGYDRLEEHLESFRLKCAAKDYQNIDWDAAFMEAIRKDWAGLRNGSVAPVQSLSAFMEERDKKRAAS